jgi:hypothetical protein
MSATDAPSARTIVCVPGGPLRDTRFMPVSGQVYDRIGGGYARGRREDPRIAAAITTALGAWTRP